MIGQTVSHYRILEELGGGGMGVVYKAEDTKLKRTVALKFLPPELTRDKDAKTRFIHEAQAASALQHHNICTIHEIDETPDGKLFICMDCYDGDTLKDKIAEGPLAIEEAIDVTSQIANGLAEAHKAGMVHRDIKPANIMVTRTGVVKILDFGLAKLAGMTRVTQTGSTVGTVAYMSPEQARGEEVDEQSDVWSLGVVFYEMVTGAAPFTGDHQAAVMYGIMHSDPTPLSISRHDAPESAQMIIDKALKKSQAERYQHVSELLADIGSDVRPRVSTKSAGSAVSSLAKRSAYPIVVAAAVAVLGLTIYQRYFTPSSPITLSQRKMIAVLPFENLGSAEDEYFADGMTDEIITRLAGIQSLGVIARTSVMQYKKTKKTIQQIGEELGVDYIIEGTVRWQRTSQGPARVRVSPQLIEVANATHLWADIYDEAAAEIFTIQTDIAGKVTRQLDVALGGAEREIIQAKPTENFDAYTKYLKARECRLSSYEEDDLLNALRLFEGAIELDSTFAQAWAELSWVHDFLYWEYPNAKVSHAIKAKHAADMALGLDPVLPAAHLSVGLYYYHQIGDYGTALKYFEAVRQLQPSNSDLYWMMGAVKRRQGRWREALEDFLMSSELDPRSALIANEVGWTYAYQGDFAAGLQYIDRAVSLAPDVFMHRRSRVRILGLYAGDFQAARLEIEEMRRRGIDESMPEQFARLMFPFDLCDGDYNGALGRLKSFSEIQDHHYLFVPRTLLYADVNRWLKNMDLAMAYYDSARTILEEAVKRNPGDSRIHSSLGLAYAGLGRKDDALREADISAELLPLSRDVLRGRVLGFQRAKTYTATGEFEAAVDQLEHLLSIPGGFPVQELRCNPAWAPLRDHPRFMALTDN